MLLYSSDITHCELATGVHVSCDLSCGPAKLIKSCITLDTMMFYEKK